MRVVTPVFSAISSMVSRLDDSSSRRIVHCLMTSALRGMAQAQTRVAAASRRSPCGGVPRSHRTSSASAHQEVGEAGEHRKGHRCKRATAVAMRPTPALTRCAPSDARVSNTSIGLRLSMPLPVGLQIEEREHPEQDDVPAP